MSLRFSPNIEVSAVKLTYTANATLRLVTAARVGAWTDCILVAPVFTH